MPDLDLKARVLVYLDKFRCNHFHTTKGVARAVGRGNVLGALRTLEREGSIFMSPPDRYHPTSWQSRRTCRCKRCKTFRGHKMLGYSKRAQRAEVRP